MNEITPAQVAERLPREQSILIAAHENPDGDALGCVVALTLMAERLDVPHVAYIPGVNDFPPEYGFLPRLDEIRRGPFPEMDASTTAYIMDCATAARLDVVGLRCAGECINIDHHQDNTRFGTLNLLDFTAASTTQILYGVFRAGRLPLDADVATPLYLGLLTDTGRFQYSNTTPAAHVMAAELQELGVDVNAVYREVYENVPLAKTRLLERALHRLRLSLDGRLAVSWILQTDFEELGAEESYTEGIIDTIRSVSGVRVAALLRERMGDGGGLFKGSLRSTDGTVDVASIAHVWSGGGHRQAAGFNAPGPLEDLVTRVEQEAASRL